MIYDHVPAQIELSFAQNVHKLQLRQQLEVLWISQPKLILEIQKTKYIIYIRVNYILQISLGFRLP